MVVGWLIRYVVASWVLLLGSTLHVEWGCKKLGFDIGASLWIYIAF